MVPLVRPVKAVPHHVGVCDAHRMDAACSGEGAVTARCARCSWCAWCGRSLNTTCEWRRQENRAAAGVRGEQAGRGTLVRILGAACARTCMQGRVCSCCRLGWPTRDVNMRCTCSQLSTYQAHWCCWWVVHRLLVHQLLVSRVGEASARRPLREGRAQAGIRHSSTGDAVGGWGCC